MKRVHGILCLARFSGVAVLFLLAACNAAAPSPGPPPQATVPQSVGSQTAQAEVAYACGGAVEARTWQLWDTQGRPWMKAHQVQARLLQRGDTYALYDIQVIFHNLEAMAQRCQRIDRLVQLADDLLPLFDALQPLPGGAPDDFAWVCRGGAVCNERNRLVNTEVMLVSVQGLGLLSALARDLATSPDPQARAHPLIAKTVQTSLQHLQRWGGRKQRQQWMQLAGASASDVKDGSSALFFTDQLMWQMAVYAHLAGVAAVQPQWFAQARRGSAVHESLSANLRALLHFFERRVTLSEVDSLLLGTGKGADLDAGFSRLYADNRFAGYSGSQPPATCIPEARDADKSVGKVASPGPVRLHAQLNLDPRKVRPVHDLGWDLSHARRLVQFLDAMTTNRYAMAAWWDIAPEALPPPDLGRAFAAQLLTKVWNGDAHAPLFTNYWTGANGWYRVAYDNGTGACYAGYKPFGLTDSFPTGGYAAWAAYFPLIGVLARAIDERARSERPEDFAFVQSYYGGLSAKASANNRMIQQLMFWPTLIAVPISP